jgi:quercetin dioxygenase-like cupin family protein
MLFRFSVILLTSVFVVNAVAHSPQITEAGAGRIVEVPFHETRLLLSQDQSEAGVSIYEFVIPPKSGGAPPHVHTHEDEYAYIIDGTLTLMLGDKIAEAGPGTLAAMTRGAVHGFWNNTEMPVKTLFFISQGGFEAFFDEVAMSLREQPPASADEANARIGKLAAEQGIIIRPELIPEDARALYQPR